MLLQGRVQLEVFDLVIHGVSVYMEEDSKVELITHPFLTVDMIQPFNNTVMIKSNGKDLEGVEP